jgi:hypothetical protein
VEAFGEEDTSTTADKPIFVARCGRTVRRETGEES